MLIPKSLAEQIYQDGRDFQLAMDERYFYPWNTHLHHLKALIDIIDAYTLAFPDDKLLEFLRNLNTTTIAGGDIEKDFSGTWYAMLSISNGLGYDFHQDYPELSSAIDRMLKGLHNALQKSDCALLRESARERPDIGSLTQIKIGRDKGINPLTDRLGAWGDRLLNEGLNAPAAAERIIEAIEALSTRDEIEKEILHELTRRPVHEYRKNKLNTRGNYLKKAVRRWRERKGIISA